MAKKREKAISEEVVLDVTKAESVEKETDKGEPQKAKTAKTASKKPDPVFTTVLQVGDKEFDITDIAGKAYKAYKSVHKRKAVSDFVVYVKPEENAAYYTVNGEGSEEYKIDL